MACPALYDCTLGLCLCACTYSEVIALVVLGNAEVIWTCLLNSHQLL